MNSDVDGADRDEPPVGASPTAHVSQILRLAHDRLKETATTPPAVLQLEVGCDSCGARATYGSAADVRAFLARHPYDC